jgi:hypothetical protein
VVWWLVHQDLIANHFEGVSTGEPDEGVVMMNFFDLRQNSVALGDQTAHSCDAEVVSICLGCIVSHRLLDWDFCVAIKTKTAGNRPGPCLKCDAASNPRVQKNLSSGTRVQDMIRKGLCEVRIRKGNISSKKASKQTRAASYQETGRARKQLASSMLHVINQETRRTSKQFFCFLQFTGLFS